MCKYKPSSGPAGARGQLISVERMRKLWVYCCPKRIKDDEEMEMKERGSAGATATNMAQLQKKKQFEGNLQGMKKIAFVTLLTAICSWFLGFCALTWASAVLLGAYIQQLSMWNYYDVSLLLFVEGLRFGVAGLLRLLHYRLWDRIRWSLESIAFYLPLGMGGFAVLSILPADIHHSIHDRFSGHSVLLHSPHGRMLSVSTVVSHAFVPAPPLSDSGYKSLSPSLNIFYTLILLNAFILLLGNSATGLMRLRYVRSNVKSLRHYHDKMLDSSTSWLPSAVDLDFAFQIQGSQYRKGNDGRHVCKDHDVDLISYLYMHDEGVEAAEAALAAEDGCVREAAANIIGFWAVLERLEEAEGVKVPLCFQKGMLSKLADIVAESYGSLGTAAARTFSLLLELVAPELIGMVASAHSKSTRQDIIDILLSRAAEVLHPPCPPTYKLPDIFQLESHAHIYALRQYLHRLQSPCEGSDIAVTVFIDAQRAQLVQKVEKALPQMVKEPNVSMIQSLDNQLSKLLHSEKLEELRKLEDLKNYCSHIKNMLIETSPSRTWAKATFLLLFNVAVPLVCLGVGFIVNALL